jgi:hypothetical protein
MLSVFQAIDVRPTYRRRAAIIVDGRGRRWRRRLFIVLVLAVILGWYS